MVTKRLIRGRP